MLSHINIIHSLKLYAFTYNLLYLLKIVAKAYNYEIAMIEKRKLNHRIAITYDR